MKLNKKHFEKINLKTKKILLGSYVSRTWEDDPIHLVFSLSRYKFVSKMLEGKKKVLEIGAGDGFQSRVVSQYVKSLDLCDIEQSNISQFKQLLFNKNKYFIHNFINKKYNKKYDAIYCLDVIEHIHKKNFYKFLKNIYSSLNSNGVLIIGTPSLESQKYASKNLKKIHINCFEKKKLKIFVEKIFKNCFVFGMNDEVLHTGFDKMCHYIFAICTK